MCKQCKDKKWCYDDTANIVDCHNEKLEVKEEKETVGTLEMAKLLLENPKRKSIYTNENGVDFEVAFVNGILTYTNSTYTMFSILENENRQWRVIEPTKQLKEMIFVEALRLWDSLMLLDGKDVKSIVTEETFEDEWKDISYEAYSGLWTIKGIYED